MIRIEINAQEVEATNIEVEYATTGIQSMTCEIPYQVVTPASSARIYANQSITDQTTLDLVAEHLLDASKGPLISTSIRDMAFDPTGINGSPAGWIGQTVVEDIRICADISASARNLFDVAV